MVTVDDGVNSLSRRGLEVLGEPKADLQRECHLPGAGAVGLAGGARWVGTGTEEGLQVCRDWFGISVGRYF